MSRRKLSVFCVLMLFTFITIGIFRLDYEISVEIYDQDEIEVNFDSGTESSFLKTNFDVFTFSKLQIMEYLKWKNENACQEYNDLGGVNDKSLKVYITVTRHLFNPDSMLNVIELIYC